MIQFMLMIKRRFHSGFLCFLVMGALGAWGCSYGIYARQDPQTHFMKMEKRVRIPKGVEARDILKTAKAYLGTRYRFGGNSTKGTDCSGFTQLVFRRHGIRLPHSSALQAQLGEFILRARKLTPGDLVFFETYRKGPSHVGIYLGENRFIHASSGQRKVTITRINSSYYGKRYLGGKRLIH